MSESPKKQQWKRMRFKNNKVWVAVDDRQAPLLKDGKALIKYQLNQDYEYWVHPHRVKALDDAGASNRSSRSTDRPKKTGRASPRKSTHAADTQNPANCENEICIYTDGACSGNPGPAGIGVVLRYKGHLKEISRYIGQATNNRAELEAIRAALLAVKNRERPVVIFTDSSYALGLLTKNWKAKQNQELVRKTRRLADQFNNLRFVKVRGHAGLADNERADRLAVAAIEKAAAGR